MNELRSRLEGGGILYGTFSLTDSPLVVEMIGHAGFDFVAIDTEHSATSPYGAVENLVRAADAVGVIPWVRVRESSAGQIGAALDAGARAVVVPHVRSRREMEEALHAVAWPPDGGRGAAPVVRAARYGFCGWEEFVGGQPLVVPLIEDAEGVEAVDEILDADGVKLVMFGAFDLAVAMGVHDPKAGSDGVEEARRRVYESAAERGVWVADYAWDAAAAKEMADSGARCVVLGNDVSILGGALREKIQSVTEPGGRG